MGERTPEEKLARYEQLIPLLASTQTGVWRRVDEGMMRQVLRKNANRVLIVTHGLTIRCFIMRFLHLTVASPDPMDDDKSLMGADLGMVLKMSGARG